MCATRVWRVKSFAAPVITRREFAQYGDPVGDSQRLFQRVRDIDDRNSLRSQRVDQQKQMLRLFRGQARGGLVEHDDLGLVVDGPSDLHHLTLGRAERRHHVARLDMEIHRLQQLLRADVDGAKPGEELFSAELNVLRHRHRRHQAVFLVDHGDTARERVGGRAEMARLAVERDLARAELHGTGRRLAQGRLAGAVLAHQRMDFAGKQIEVDVLNRRRAFVHLRGAADPEFWRAPTFGKAGATPHRCLLLIHPLPPPPTRRRAAGHCPSQPRTGGCPSHGRP